MKAIKFLALMLVALVSMTACNDDDNEGDGNNSSKPINLNLTGYIFVSSKYFQDTYYGNDAKLKIYPEDDQYKVEFHDPQWGDVTFENVTLKPELSGTGKLSLAYHGGSGEYDAVLSGSIMMPVITVDMMSMGTTTITFYAGEAPLAYQMEGKHKGTNVVTVDKDYNVDATFSISANADGTLNITIPEYSLAGTPMGDMTIGEVTIKNIAYNEKKKAFYRLYGADELSVHVTAIRDGAPVIDKDYTIINDTKETDKKYSHILIEQTEDGTKVTNSFKPEGMPFPIIATFTETATGEDR